MSIILHAIFPIILLLGLGNILRRLNFVTAEFWRASDKLTYYVLFPGLLISKMADIDIARTPFTPVFGFLSGYFIIMSLMAYGIYRFCRCRPAQLSSVYQGIIRFNSYIYFALVEALWGTDSLGYAAILAGLVIPIVNVCCVSSFFVGKGAFSWRLLLQSLAINPLIIGVILGFIINQYPILMPRIGMQSLEILGNAALPLALLSVGAALKIKRLWQPFEGFSLTSIWLTTLGKLVIAPSVAYLLVWALGIDPFTGQLLILLTAIPTATAAYILAKQLKGDADMMVVIISLQTITAIATLTFWLAMII
ncbi:AEC family transporter [Ostreibacterium oceani]|uniref:Transporter n=1 Tax=Ostreibacterium oceani TaxID=2654998 RepID=A0A6N7EYA7_9GAMM|nr:AEC family transporter [Ostreibacterium oceani]MPV86933.1 hypothetical protein [Ostreibacterium oceani]